MIGLLALLDEHSEAIEYDLIALGLRLRDWPSRSFHWGDLLAIVKHSPPGSALNRALDPGWRADLDTELLRRIDTGVRVLAWQNSGGRGAQPEPVPFPWDVRHKAWEADALAWDEAADALGGDERMREAMGRAMATMHR